MVGDDGADVDGQHAGAGPEEQVIEAVAQFRDEDDGGHAPAVLGQVPA